MRKRAFWHICTIKSQINLRILAVWSVVVVSILGYAKCLLFSGERSDKYWLIAKRTKPSQERVLLGKLTGLTWSYRVDWAVIPLPTHPPHPPPKKKNNNKKKKKKKKKKTPPLQLLCFRHPSERHSENQICGQRAGHRLVRKLMFLKASNKGFIKIIIHVFACIFMLYGNNVERQK